MNRPAASTTLTPSAGVTTAPAELSFIIPVRNDAARLGRCLESILRNRTARPIEIVVVDNGSEDDSAGVGRRLGADVICLPDAHVSRLRNEGVARSRGRLLAFVDADHEIDPGWIEAAIDRFEDTHVAAAGAPCHPPADGTWVQRMYDRFRTHDVQAADARWLGSGNLVVSREAFDAVGGFDASLEVCEDVDLCSRLRRAGYRLVNDPALVSAHAGDPETLRALFKSELWRSRNNIQVTLRSDRSWRSLVSLAIPVLNLAAIATLVLAGLYRWILPAALAAALTGALALLYTVVMLQRGRPALRVAVQAFVVASVYNLARSLALVWPAKHRRARPPKNLVAPEIR